ncbi:hypothetical protein ACJMK2_000378, partial [Sinanodonta woodiana]
ELEPIFRTISTLITCERTVICGDFNAHNKQWGGGMTDKRGRLIEAWANTSTLTILNDGAGTRLNP